MENSAIKILIIEDEANVRASLDECLRAEGYEVFMAGNGEEGLASFRSSTPDLVILDVMMPVMDGLEVCKQLRTLNAIIPIIMLTAKGSEIDKVLGLELGADDYLAKPFAMRELLARIKAVLRRTAQVSKLADAIEVEQTDLVFEDVTIDFKSYRARKGEEELDFSAKEFELMKFMSSTPDVPFTRDQLLDKVWGYNSYPSTRTVDNFIARLRQKVEETPDEPKHILTVHGVGYKFVL